MNIDTSSNKLVGFNYKGDNNKCYLFDTDKMTNKLDYDIINKYNVKSFVKTKNTIDFDDSQDKHNQYNYFNQLNNNYYNIDGLLNTLNVKSERECLEKCMDNSNNTCKSVIYLEEPKKCTFYSNKDMKFNNNNNNDNNEIEKTYTIKNNININNAINDIKNNITNNYNNMDRTANLNKIKDNPILYKCNGLNSTNPFCTKPFNPDNIENNELQYYTDCLDKQFETSLDQEKYYNSECKKKYGDEYIFDNDYQNLDSIIKYNLGNQARCKIGMYGDNIIEKFDNGNCIVYNNQRETFENYIEQKHYFRKILWLFIILCLIIIIFLSCN